MILLRVEKEKDISKPIFNCRKFSSEPISH